MRIVFWVWVRGRWRRLTVERCPEKDGIELVAFPPARTRAIRDRLYASLAADGYGEFSLRIEIRPSIKARVVARSDLALLIAARWALSEPTGSTLGRATS